MSLLHPWSRLAVVGVSRRVSPRKLAPESIKRWNIVVGDKVEVIAGHEKGKQGTVLSVHRDMNKVRIEGINLRRRYVPSVNEQPAGMYSFEAPLSYSSLALVDPSDKKATRVRWGLGPDKKKVRISVRTDSVIPHPPFQRRDWKLRSAYQDTKKDTAAKSASKVTYKPSVLSFEESVLADLGLITLSAAGNDGASAKDKRAK